MALKIKSNRPAAAEFNGLTAVSVRDVEKGDKAYNENDKLGPQVIATFADGTLSDGRREIYFYADEVVETDADKAGVKAGRLSEGDVLARAKQLCEAENGAGSWDAADKAQRDKYLQQARGEARAPEQIAEKNPDGTPKFTKINPSTNTRVPDPAQSGTNPPRTIPKRDE